MSQIKAFWQSEGLRKVLIAVGVFYILIASSVIILQQYQQRQYTQNAHANTVAILSEHTKTLDENTKTLTEVAQLRAEVTKLVTQDGPLITAGQLALINKLSWIECAVALGPSKCGSMP